MADNFKTPKWYGTPALKKRLIEISGSQSGFLDDAISTLAAMPGGKAVSKGFIYKLVNGRTPAPMWIVIGLTRMAEDDLAMDRNAAVDCMGRWFTIVEEVSL